MHERGSPMSTPTTYRGSITREQWLVDETRTVARLRLEDPTLLDTRALAEYILENNLFQYPTEREVGSIARACARRLDALSSDPDRRNRLTGLIARGTIEQLRQANLYALMCDNRLVWDFMTCVVADKFSMLDTHLRKAEIAAFLEGLRAQDERVATWSPATLNKIRQVLSHCLEQCGMYDRKTERLSTLLLDYDLENLMRENGDAGILPAFGLAQ